MDFSFASAKLQKELSDQKSMRRAYGERAPALQRRLTTLSIVEKLSDVPRGPPDWLEQLKGDRDEQFSVVLTKNWRLIFVVGHNPVPRLNDGGIDLDNVTAVHFVEIV